MCGRARCTLSREEVMAAACVGQDQATSWRDEQKYHPSANVGPGQTATQVGHWCPALFSTQLHDGAFNGICIHWLNEELVLGLAKS